MTARSPSHGPGARDLAAGLPLPLLLFLGGGQAGVVDRLEEEWAVVEWSDGAFVDVPIRELPCPGVEEGAHLRVLLISAPRGPWVFADGHPAWEPEGSIGSSRFRVPFCLASPSRRHGACSSESPCSPPGVGVGRLSANRHVVALQGGHHEP